MYFKFYRVWVILKKTCTVITLVEGRFDFGKKSLSSTEVCVVGTLGRRKKQARGARWEREEARHAFYFSIIASSSLGCPVGAFAEERDKKRRLSYKTIWKCSKRDLLDRTYPFVFIQLLNNSFNLFTVSSSSWKLSVETTSSRKILKKEK